MTNAKKRQRNKTKHLLHSKSGWLCDPQHVVALEREYNASLRSGAPAISPNPDEITITDEGILHMPINGLVFATPNRISRHFGMLSTLELMEAVRESQTMKDVVGIFAEIDSGGGEAGYLFEFADLLMNSQKPVVTFSATMATSAAMMMMVAGHYPIASPEAVLGSIGVKGYKPSPYAREYHITSKNAKNKIPDAKQISKLANQTEAIFIKSVMQATGMTHGEVVKNGNEGGLLIAEDALNAGFLHGVGTRQEAIEHLSKMTNGAKPLKNRNGTGTTETNSATEQDLNARWDTLLAYVDSGVSLKTCQKIAKSSMTLDEAKDVLESLAASAESPTGGQGGDSGDSGDGGQPGQSDTEKLAAALTAVAESNLKTQSMIQKLAARESGTVEPPTPPQGGNSADEENGKGKKSELTAADIEKAKLSNIAGLVQPL